MAATPEDVADPEPFSPSLFLNLPPTPHPHHPDGEGDGEDDLQVLPFIRRMLMEEEGTDDDAILYQEYPDHHPALLRAQQPFAQILSAPAAATDSVSGPVTTDSAFDAFADATWPYDPVELSQLLFSRTRSGTGVGVHGFTGGADAANSFSSPGPGVGQGSASASGCGQARAFFNAGDSDTATIQSSSFGDGGVAVTMDMLNQAFLKGMEEANKFLPTTTIFGLDPTSREHLPISSVVDYGRVSGRGCKNRHNWDDDDDTGRRSNKLLAPEPEKNGEQVDAVFVQGYEMAIEKMHGLSISSNDNNNNGKAKRKSASQGDEAVDLRTLLTHCAEAVSTGDRRSATELLRQIRQRSSPRGDASQRLAHCFAEALEARLAGTGALVAARRTTGDLDFLRAYKLYLEVCSFKMIAFKFAHIAICKAITGRKKVHIVEYGDHHGLHWPPLLEAWSKDRDGGPPEVRITSIDCPQPGFRPAARIEETGRRLSDFARRRGVPFRFRSVVASKWETVCADDLDIEPDDDDEVLVVNGLFHFGRLMDEGVDIDTTSPRDMVLRNIQKMRPDVFILCVENSSYNAPFFVTRFREALFYYSAMFDMMETTTPQRDSEERLLVEQDILGACVLNAIACEGSDRVERPETYKQWQVRGHRAGLKQLPLNPNTVKYLTRKVKDGYHKDFVVDVDQQWLLQGWKGRILYAMSTWVADHTQLSQS